MRRSAALAFLAMLLSGNLTYGPVARADDDWNKRDPAAKIATKTPIKHVVVIFDENNSFDHYFGTYPNALNLPGETSQFYPAPDTPLVNGLTPTLLTNNPNKLSGGSNPFRLAPSQAATCNNSNNYTLEQEAFDGGLLDKFSVTAATKACGFFLPTPPQLLSMGYYDGNTVTALWNYAQHFSMSDNFFDTLFGVTVMGHMNLLSGQTNGLIVKAGSPVSPTVISNGSIIANVQPYYDDCAAGVTPNVVMTGKNVGDLLNAAGVSWGWFYGDFGAVSITSLGGVPKATCTAIYNSHYAPFDYYQDTSNPHHIPPSSLAAIGTDTCIDQMCANHNYDLSYFFQALSNGNLPAVTYLKFSETDTGHAADSTPLLEQTSIVNAINAIEQSPFWRDTAIMITYDDSGGWYDHAAGPIVNFSQDPDNDAISGNPATSTGACGKPGPGVDVAIQDRCGFGVRLPFLLVSPYAKRNYVDHSLNDTTSILRFIEYNWGLGTIGDPQSFDVLASGTLLGMFDFDDKHGDDRREESRKLVLDPTTGQVVGP
ncbi:MAG TPA: alkaline phosphatase family protein [Acidobacteriaceae bacterium]|jgi:phospholipase C